MISIMFCFTLLLIYSQFVDSWRFKDYPYADLNFAEKAKHDGYPLWKYQLTTEDDYILTTYRIPYGRQSNNKTNRSPVLILHGMGGSPEMFVMLGKGRALAYNLADSGFDVWILSFRGTGISTKHKYYDIDKDLDYWNFGFHEMAIYDIPASVDFIWEKTGQKVFIIGHSQGNTCYFIFTSEKPEYNQKIKIGVAYAPSVVLHHMDIPVATLFVHSSEVVKGFYNLIGFRELFPFIEAVQSIGGKLCREQTFFLELCNIILSIIGSHKSNIIDKDIVPVISNGQIGRSSVTQLLHYMQVVKSGQFKQYDHGWTENLKKYGNATPPTYDLTKSTVATALYYGEKDDIISRRGAFATMKSLPNVIVFEQIDYFNHLDFLFGSNASESVYQKTIKLFQDYDDSLQLNDSS